MSNKPIPTLDAASSPAVTPQSISEITPPAERQNADAGLSEKGSRTLFTRRTQSLLGVQVISTGSYVPENVVTNEDLRDRSNFDPEWIK